MFYYHMNFENFVVVFKTQVNITNGVTGNSKDVTQDSGVDKSRFRYHFPATV